MDEPISPSVVVGSRKLHSLKTYLIVICLVLLVGLSLGAGYVWFTLYNSVRLTNHSQKYSVSFNGIKNRILFIWKIQSVGLFKPSGIRNTTDSKGVTSIDSLRIDFVDDSQPGGAMVEDLSNPNSPQLASYSFTVSGKTGLMTVYLNAEELQKGAGQDGLRVVNQEIVRVLIDVSSVYREQTLRHQKLQSELKAVAAIKNSNDYFFTYLKK